MAEEKTNVMRILEQKKIPYTPHYHPYSGGPITGSDVAQALGVAPSKAFKTLVTQGASKQYYVFVVPVLAELDLKPAAKSVGEKSIAMLRLAELQPLTGYIHGGCSPVGMKRQFKTVLDESALGQETILVSGGRIGAQVEVVPADLAGLVGARFAPIAK